MDGQTFHMVCVKRYNNDDMLHILENNINNTYDINLRDDNGETILMALSDEYQTENVVKYLLSQRRDIDVNMTNNNGQTALVLAAVNNAENILNDIAKHKHTNAHVDCLNLFVDDFQYAYVHWNL